jgi:phosphoribosylformylglycinamidine synthase subunit PurQ / glutaminase
MVFQNHQQDRLLLTGKRQQSMAKNAKAIVLAGNGTNCEAESAFACKKAGFEQVDIITVWELLHGDARLDGYDFLVLPGGFLDGDDLGSAKAQANRILRSRVEKSSEPLFSQFSRFISSGGLMLGICNGFQLMVKLGLLPGLDKEYDRQLVTLTNNDSGRFEDRWVWLTTNRKSPCVFTRGIDTIYLPIRHGEGKFVAQDTETLDLIINRELVVFSYVDPQSGKKTMDYPENPNGSQMAIAGICDPTGRIFGLMPHPEAYLDRTNHPRWTREDLPEEGMGLALFKNAYQFIKDNP